MSASPDRTRIRVPDRLAMQAASASTMCKSHGRVDSGLVLVTFHSVRAFARSRSIRKLHCTCHGLAGVTSLARKRCYRSGHTSAWPPVGKGTTDPPDLPGPVRGRSEYLQKNTCFAPLPTPPAACPALIYKQLISNRACVENHLEPAFRLADC